MVTAPLKREGDTEVSQSSCWQGVLRKEQRGWLWLPWSEDDFLVDLQDHVLGQKCSVYGAGWEPDSRMRLPDSLSVSVSRFIFKGWLQQRNSIPFLSQLGNVGTNILLTFPRLLNQRGEEKPDLSWSADQGLTNTKQTSLQLQGHKVCGLVFSKRV